MQQQLLLLLNNSPAIWWPEPVPSPERLIAVVSAPWQVFSRRTTDLQLIFHLHSIACLAAISIRQDRHLAAAAIASGSARVD